MARFRREMRLGETIVDGGDSGKHAEAEA